MAEEKLPIGYYIKQADTLLTTATDSIHSKRGLNRTAWQLLHTIQQKGSISRAELVGLMRPFANEEIVLHTVEEFMEHGYAKDDEHLVCLTDEGKALHKICYDEQLAFREQTMQGVSDGDYEATVKTLKQMVANMEANKQP